MAETYLGDASSVTLTPVAGSGNTFTTSKGGVGAGSDPSQPDYVSSFYRAQAPRWKMIDALWGGTETMRAAGAAYLPVYQHEGNDMWKRRLAGAVLLNFFRKTVEGYVGKPFGRPLVVPESMPETLKLWFQDVDGRGTNLDMFAQRGFEKGMAKGVVHGLVDYPKSQEGDTAADEADRQPVLCLVCPENLIGARQDAEGDLQQVRIFETKIEPDGAFGEEACHYIRVLEDGKYTLYKKEKTATRWESVENGEVSIEGIPFTTFLADEEGFMCSRPPLLDLAYKNVEHWQSSSDQRNILTVCRFPILVGSGVNPSDPLTIGPNSYYGMRDPASKLYWVEHGGSAIASGRDDLETIKAEMAVLGLSMLMPQKSGDITATAKAIDGAESVTELQRIVMRYENFINECIYWAAVWMEIPEADDLPRVTVDPDYAKMLSLDSSVQALLSARSSGDLSRRALLEALKRRNLLPRDFDIDEDAELLKEEKAMQPQGMPAAVPGKPGLLGSKPEEDDEEDDTSTGAKP